MDAERFDAMTKLITRTSRRRVLTGLVTGLAAVLARGRSSPIAAQPQPGRRPGRCGPVGQPCKFHQHCCEPLVCFGGYCAASTEPPPPTGCSTPSECEQPSHPCQEASCVGGQCEFANVTGGEITCGVGACQRTVQKCIDGVLQPCEPGQPSEEVCNGIDDDCDGQIDSNIALVGQPCDGTDADSFEEGVIVCMGGALVCTDNTP